jgi:hypothetical protein
MSEHEQPGSKLDKWIADYLLRQSDTLSRRSMLARIGRVVLGLSGLSLIPLLPVDRRFAVSAATGCSWETCGMCGYLCVTASTCCSGTGGYAKCPTCSGMATEASWGKCCYPCTNSCCTGTMFSYSDCCTTNSANASQCKGTPCQKACYPDFPAYCVSKPYYACTIVTTGGSC